MNLRVIPDPEDGGMSVFVLVCNQCDKPIRDINKGVVRWFEDSGHIVVAHKGKCDVAMKSVVGELPAVDVAVMTVCMAANLSIDSRQEWIDIWDENISEVETYSEEIEDE
jgi:hypothetical protein